MNLENYKIFHISYEETNFIRKKNYFIFYAFKWKKNWGRRFYI